MRGMLLGVALAAVLVAPATAAAHGRYTERQIRSDPQYTRTRVSGRR